MKISQVKEVAECHNIESSIRIKKRDLLKKIYIKVLKDYGLKNGAVVDVYNDALFGYSGKAKIIGCNLCYEPEKALLLVRIDDKSNLGCSYSEISEDYDSYLYPENEYSDNDKFMYIDLYDMSE